MANRSESEVAARLVAAGCVAATEEAAELLAVAPDAATLDAMVGRRESGEPLAWITGRVEFCGRRFRVAPGVYVPRPHTEELARRATALLPKSGRALDVCTGSGIVAASMVADNATARVVATDIDRQAAACARRNGVRAIVTHLADAVACDGSWDVVTAVAPYVPTGELRLLPSDVQAHEPTTALDGGDDGLALVRRIVRAGARLLRPGGHLLVELGGDQEEALGPFLRTHGFGSLEVWRDELGDLRGLSARREQP